MGGVPRPFPSGPPPKPLPHWIQILLVIPVLVAFGHQAYRRYKTGGRKWTVDLVLALAGALVAAFALLQEAWLGGYLAKIVAVLGIYLTQLLAVCIVIGLGWTAHWFKQRNQLYYGYLEIVFGSFSAIAIVHRIQFSASGVLSLGLAQVAALVGAAYVVARGLNNCSEARRKANQ